MRISTSLLLPALISAASAISDTASVYIFQGEEYPKSADAQPTLTPEQTRLVIAQRLGVSQYHSLKGANRETLSYINKFSGHEDPLFDGVAQDKAAELVVVIDNVSPETAEPLISSWKSIDPAFFVSKPPSFKANQKLTRDLNQQRHGHGDAWDMECGLKQAINPYNEKCWAGRTKMLHLDLKKQAKNHVNIDDFMAVEETLRRLAKKQEMNLMVVLMPTSSTKISSKAYGSYQMPSSTLGRRQQQAEEIITEVPFTSSPSAISHISQVDQAMAPDTTFPPLRGVIAWCHSSIEACMSATNNCSGHGSCFAKYNSTDNPGDGKSGCFTCGCLPEKSSSGKSNGTKTTYWGGAACNKKDVSGPFWLLFGLSLFLVVVVGYSISLLFSIGEEKLPGVIGAGVSSKSR